MNALKLNFYCYNIPQRTLLDSMPLNIFVHWNNSNVYLICFRFSPFNLLMVSYVPCFITMIDANPHRKYAQMNTWTLNIRTYASIQKANTSYDKIYLFLLLANEKWHENTPNRYMCILYASKRFTAIITEVCSEYMLCKY